MYYLKVIFIFLHIDRRVWIIHLIQQLHGESATQARLRHEHMLNKRKKKINVSEHQEIIMQFRLLTSPDTEILL